MENKYKNDAELFKDITNKALLRKQISVNNYAEDLYEKIKHNIRSLANDGKEVMYYEFDESDELKKVFFEYFKVQGVTISKNDPRINNRLEEFERFFIGFLEGKGFRAGRAEPRLIGKIVIRW
jgi:hypothetical protein